MREEIRLGNEALEQNDLDAARQYFQQVLTAGGTAVQLRIAENRLRDIHDKIEALQNPTPAKTRARRKTAATKTAAAKAAATEDPPHTVVRPPDNPVVVIRKH